MKIAFLHDAAEAAEYSGLVDLNSRWESGFPATCAETNARLVIAAARNTPCVNKPSR